MQIGDEVFWNQAYNGYRVMVESYGCGPMIIREIRKSKPHGLFEELVVELADGRIVEVMPEAISLARVA